jgi:hypothetical protein
MKPILEVNKHFSNDFSQKKNCVWIPFCESSVGAFHGRKDGYVRMDGERNYLSITPRTSAGLSPTCNLNITETATSGTFRLSYKGEYTNLMNYNTSANGIKSELENLKNFRDIAGVPLTCTITGSFDSGTTIAFSFDQKFKTSDFPQIHTEDLQGASGIVTPLTFVTEAGAKGFTSGQYDVSIYAYVHSKLMNDTSGRLMITTE